MRQNNSKPPIKKSASIIQQSSIYQGPVPDPVILQKFKEIDSSYPDRIFKMAEGHAKAADKERNRASFAMVAIPIIGQILTFLLGISSLALSAFLIIKGFPIASIIPLIAGFSPILIEAIKKIRK
ncbi:MAG: hypothetical protein IK015_10470 [Treponema sp.]|nr:hypothetical protein [Treponema sp.]